VHAAGAEVGEPAPVVSLPSLTSNAAINLESLRGKVVYLDFWASWCPPCRVSFPILESIRQSLGPQGFEVYAISVDEDKEDALAFLEDAPPVSYLLLHDPYGDTPKIYGVRGMPTGYLIDRKGVVRKIHEGFKKSDGEKLRAAVEQLLGE
jgi:thiol-disulfide isomerase/thioredoxin